MAARWPSNLPRNPSFGQSQKVGHPASPSLPPAPGIGAARVESPQDASALVINFPSHKPRNADSFPAVDAEINPSQGAVGVDGAPAPPRGARMPVFQAPSSFVNWIVLSAATWSLSSSRTDGTCAGGHCQNTSDPGQALSQRMWPCFSFQKDMPTLFTLGPT